MRIVGIQNQNYYELHVLVVETRPEMNNILLFVPLFALAAIGVSQDLTPLEQEFLRLLGEGHDVTLTHGIGITWLAYGQEYETSIETDFPVTYFRCLDSSTETFPQVDCLLKGTNSFIGGDGVTYVYDGTVDQYKPHAQMVEEAIELQKEKTPEIFMGTEKEILEEKKELTIEEQHRLNYYEGIDDCVNNVLAFQSGRIFEVERDDLGQPIIPKAPDNSKWRIGSDTYKIAMANNECVGQMSIYAMIGDRTYPVIDYNPYHAEIAQSLEPWTQDRLTTVSNFGLEKWNENATWCDYYPSHTRGMFAQCESEDQYWSTKPTPVSKDYYDTDPMRKFFEWNDDPNTQLKDIMSKMNRDLNVERTIGGSQ